MTLALLCTGQGHQHTEMFRLTGHLASTQSLFAAATPLLGWDPQDMAHCADSDLFANRSAQVLCTLQALAARAALRDALPRRLCVAGYSVGELAAWGVAGGLPPLQTLHLAADRADAMDAACQGAQGLLAVRGLDEPTMRGVCAESHAAIAIANPDSAWVVGGLLSDLDAVAQAARQRGAARVTPLRVTVASHTPLMLAAAQAFEQHIFAAPLADRLPAGVRLFTGIDGAAVFDVREGAGRLAAQIAQTIRWDACLQGCVEAGATAFLELGPGHALADMAAAAYPGIPARSLDAFATLDSARAWIARVTATQGY